MNTELSSNALNTLFSSTREAVLVIEGEYFIKANQVALDLLEISSVKAIKALHPAMFSPEFQPDGESSKLKANYFFTKVQEEDYVLFTWQHLSLKKVPFDVEVTLRKREENGHNYIDVHWRSLA